MNPIAQLDQDITLAINSCNSDLWDPVMYQVSNRFVWFGLAALLIFGLFRSVRPNYRKATIFLIFMVLMILCADQICNAFKYSVQRLRPCWDEAICDQVHIVNGDKGGHYGFFSAHAAIFFGIALMTAKFFKKRWYTLLIYTIALIVSYSRIYLGRHYLGDVLCGAIEGTVVGILIWYFYGWFLERYNRKHPHYRYSR